MCGLADADLGSPIGKTPSPSGPKKPRKALPRGAGLSRATWAIAVFAAAVAVLVARQALALVAVGTAVGVVAALGLCLALCQALCLALCESLGQVTAISSQVTAIS